MYKICNVIVGKYVYSKEYQYFKMKQSLQTDAIIIGYIIIAFNVLAIQNDGLGYTGFFLHIHRFCPLTKLFHFNDIQVGCYYNIELDIKYTT